MNHIYTEYFFLCVHGLKRQMTVGCDIIALANKIPSKIALTEKSQEKNLNSWFQVYFNSTKMFSFS